MAAKSLQQLYRLWVEGEPKRQDQFIRFITTQTMQYAVTELFLSSKNEATGTDCRSLPMASKKINTGKYEEKNWPCEIHGVAHTPTLS